MGSIFIAWWNCENLFDTENATGRSEKLERTLGSELKGWTAEVLAKKIDNLKTVINNMNAGKGPDILGVCEVENRQVLEQLSRCLCRSSYNVVHSDSNDGRGIDVAFVYDSDIFSVEDGGIFSHFVMKRTATRDILQVNFIHKETGNKIFLIGNHWPSRSGGQYESEPYRMMAGETLAYYHERIHDIHGDDAAVMALGDFNDAPYNRSVIEYAMAVNDPMLIIRATKKKYFCNLMWPFLGKGQGTLYYDGWDLLDQIMVSEGIISGKSGFTVPEGACRIEADPAMVKNGKPLRFGRPSDKDFKGVGFSDHFPVSVSLAY